MGAGVPCVSPTSEAPDHSLLLHITYLILCLLFNMMFPTVWVWVWVWVCVFLCVSVCVMKYPRLRSHLLATYVHNGFKQSA